jgi:hypothetical protein
MIWGKTAKACGTAGDRDNGVPIDLVGGSVQEPVNLEDTEEHDAPPSPNRQVHATLLKAVRLDPHHQG